MFVILSIGIWLAISAIVLVLPMLGLGKFINLALLAHPGALVFAAFPLISRYVKATPESMPYGRAARMALIAMVILVPLSILATSLNTWAMVTGLHNAGILAEPPADPNYIIISVGSLFITALMTFIGLGFVFPAQVNVQRKRAAKAAR